MAIAPMTQQPRYRSLRPQQPMMGGDVVQPPTQPPAPKPMIPETVQPPGVVPPPTRPTATVPIQPPTAKPTVPTIPPNGETPPRPTGPTPPKPETITPPPAPITPLTSPVGENLRSDIYTPGDDPRLKGAMGATDRAASAVGGYDRSAMQTGNEGRYRSVYGSGQVSGTMDELNNAPDRTALALQKLKDFDTASNETRFNEERDLGRNIAKFGRTGLQANADNFGEIQRRIANDRARLANELASSVAEGDINDRFRKVDMNTGLAERNEDRGFQRTNAAVNAASNLTDRGVGDLYDQFESAGTLEDRIFGEGASNRGEYRTERGRQDTQAQQTIENRIEEMRIKQELEDQRIRRAMAIQQAGGAY